MNETLKLPLWKSCLETMRNDGFTYGKSWPVEFFESALHCKSGTPQFAFEMMALKETIEKEDGYYLRSSENGKLWDIPVAFAHEDISQRLERGLRRDAVRVINLRSATLLNPAANLTDAERSKMERGLEKAATRLVLISRQTAVEKILKDKAPKLLKK